MALLTLSQVNALLPRLAEIFERLDVLESEISARANEVERMGFNPATTKSDERPAHVAEREQINAEKVQEYQSEIDKIDELGGILRDVELGLVDFPSELDGDRIVLSWRRGESNITHFNAPGAPFTRRRRLPTS